MVRPPRRCPRGLRTPMFLYAPTSRQSVRPRADGRPAPVLTRAVARATSVLPPVRPRRRLCGYHTGDWVAPVPTFRSASCRRPLGLRAGARVSSGATPVRPLCRWSCGFRADGGAAPCRQFVRAPCRWPPDFSSGACVASLPPLSSPYSPWPSPSSTRSVFTLDMLSVAAITACKSCRLSILALRLKRTYGGNDPGHALCRNAVHPHSVGARLRR
jgi:hypothetical protein